ncbi:MAG: ATP-binding cassette domain-containing protein [Spirochaetales bacterium]|nr:ATP-binding cassette domain-containing protein [Spirochaetales bacterium]
MSKNNKDCLLKVDGLKKYFPMNKGLVKAVDDVSFSINRGETLGLVGESGCGKSTTARTIIRLYNPDSGSIELDGFELASLSQKRLMPHRKKMQMIFQDPYSSLNGRMTVRDIINEPISVHTKLNKNDTKNKINDLLERVGLNAGHANRYPHEFSGGQRQRIGIARALAANPDFIICDEPISALDVSIQAQVVNMLEELQEEFGLTYLFIAHDLSMVRHISNQMGVMYLGRIVEIGESSEIYREPKHPYTQALLGANPVPDPRIVRQKLKIIGDIPSPLNIPSGCRFRTRCPHAMDICSKEEPQLTGSGRQVACHLHT